MTSATSLHFGPEWMRKPKPAPASPGPNGNASNPLTTTPNSNYGPGPVNGTPTISPNSSNTGQTHSSYSSLLASPMQPPEPVSDSTNPFRYSKEQMLAVWKNGGGHGELGLEVERWPGIVTEETGEPLGLTDLSPEEKKVRLGRYQFFDVKGPFLTGRHFNTAICLALQLRSSGSPTSRGLVLCPYTTSWVRRRV